MGSVGDDIRPRRSFGLLWLALCPPSAWNEGKHLLHVLHSYDPAVVAVVVVVVVAVPWARRMRQLAISCSSSVAWPDPVQEVAEEVVVSSETVRTSGVEGVLGRLLVMIIQVGGNMGWFW